MNKINKIKKSLENDDILIIIKKKKYNLLSENEKKLLNVYLNDKRLIKYKKNFIISFVNRLKNMNEISLKKYIYELNEICLKGINSQLGMIFDIDYDMPISTSKIKEKPVGYSKDFYFNELVEKENYDELNNLYGIYEIERDSNILKDRNK